MKLLGWVAGLILLLLAVLVSLPFSGAGTQFLVRVAGSYAPLEIDYRGGRLFGELQLARLSLRLAAVELELEDVATDLQWRCFWRSTFCFDRVSAGTVSVLIPPGDGSDPELEEPATRELLLFPYAVDVEQLDVGALDVLWSGGQWSQDALTANVFLADDTIRVADAQLDNAILQIDGSDEPGDGYAGFDPPDIFLPLVLAVDGLLLNGGELQLSDASWSMDSAFIEGRWSAETLTLQDIKLEADALGELGGSGTLDFKQSWPLSLGASLAFSSDFELPELQGRELVLSAEGDLESLEVSLDSAGAPAVAVEGTMSPARENLPMSLGWRLAWQEAIPLGEVLGGASGDLLIRKPVTGRVEGNLEEQHGQFSGALRGAGFEALEFETQWRRQGLRLDILQFQLVDEPSDSAITAYGTLHVDEGWTFNANLQSPGFLVPPLLTEQPGRLSGGLELVASGASDTWQVAFSEVDLEGTIDGLPAYVLGASGINSDLRLLPGTLEGEFNGARVSLAASDVTGEARASLQLDHLGRWLDGARGSLNVRAQGELAREKFAMEATGSDLAYGGLALGAAEATGSWDVASGALQGRLSLPSLEIPARELTVTDLQLQLTGDTESHQIELRSAGDLAGNLRVDGALEEGRWRGVLQATRLATPAGEWTLSEAVTLAWDGQARQFAMDAHCWQHEQFQLCGDRIRAGGEGDIQLRLAGNVRAFRPLLPRSLRVRGPIEAELQAGWSEDSDLAVDARAIGKRITVVRRYGMGERVEVSWEDVRLNVQLEEGELAFDGTVNREGRRVAAFQAVLPPERDGALSGQLTLDRLKLSAFAPWVTELSDLSGDLSGEIQLSGKPEEIQANGYLALADGHMVALGNPTELTDLQLRLDLDGTQGELTGRGLLGGGELALEGLLSSAPELRLDLSLRGDRHTVLMPPASEAVVSEELQLVLKGDLLDVRGNVRVHEGVLRHEELPDTGVSMSSDVVIVDLSGSVIQEDRPFEIRSDLALNIRDRFRIETDEFRATLGGNLQLVQEPGRPMQLFGTLNVLGGELEAFRQRLIIQRGSFAFTGPTDNPELDISAEREIRSENVTVGARVFGRAQDPELEVYSSPVMSQSEAMSYLVRGRGLDSGAAADGTALALSLGADVVNQSGVVDELNRLPMISNVAFGASGDEDDTAATVSGYVGERLYLSYGIGIYEPINVLTARLYLQSRLWIEVVSRLENSIDLYYSFDIE